MAIVVAAVVVAVMLIVALVYGALRYFRKRLNTARAMDSAEQRPFEDSYSY